MKSQEPLSFRSYLLIALVGAAPDWLNPLFTLEARLSSWSHSVFGLSGVTLLMVFLSHLKSVKLSFENVLFLSLVYAFHIFCDAIGGEVALIHPLDIMVLGDYYVLAMWWIPIDIVCLLSVYFIWRYPRLNAADKASKNR
ncbi:MAG: hypothetical protein ABGY95_08030 [Rubritalea sp.]|uniref:hypothetical protein n=1 Tax=Rubritalea sp. TaxID=2109375 RepID=UPI003241FBE8